MIKPLLALFSCALLSCSNYGQLTFITSLPGKLDENSGIAILDSTSVWMIEDGNNKDKIYQVDFTGTIRKAIEVKNAKNKDWEDLAWDPSGNVYIADLGNNSHKRTRDLVIYKIPDPRLEGGDEIDAEKIRIQYPAMNGEGSGDTPGAYDSEAIFFREGFLYIITKDRGSPFTGKALIFKVPAEKGDYRATPVGSFTPCQERGHCEITAADLSPDGKRVALLGYGTLWIFSDFLSDDFTRGTLTTINLGATTQLESVGFLTNSTLLVSDEERGTTGRNLYKFHLD